MPSVTALRRWLVFVALLRLFSGVGQAQGAGAPGAALPGGSPTSPCRPRSPALRPPSAAVGLGYAAPHRFQTNLYTKQPEGGACGEWEQWHMVASVPPAASD